MFTGRSRTACFRVMQAVFLTTLLPKKTSICESLFDCMMQIIVLLMLPVPVQCWFKLLIMACCYCWYISICSLKPYLHNNTTGSPIYTTKPLCDPYYNSQAHLLLELLNGVQFRDSIKCLLQAML